MINADDFGFAHDVNAGIVYAHRHGVLTSTTLMANGTAFEDAVHLARETPSLDIGCHLVLVQGRSVHTGQPLPQTISQLLIALGRNKIDVHSELRAQIEKIFAAGLRPTHLDTHKHAHIVPAVFRVVVRLAHEFGIPYVRLPLDETVPFGRVPCRLAGRLYRRFASAQNTRMTDHFLGFRLTGSLTVDTFRQALLSLPNGNTEFMCHPGFVSTELQRAATRLKDSRGRELEALTAPGIREWIAAQNICLTGFDGLSA